MFQDITTLLLNPAAYKDCLDLLVERYRSAQLDVIAGFEARGFLFGPGIALALGLPFVPLRKPKKLPGARACVHARRAAAARRRGARVRSRGCACGRLTRRTRRAGPVISESYALEYGTDALEMHVGAVSAGQRVLLVDDLIATGGTLAAGARLMRRAGATPVEACCIIELPELGVRARRPRGTQRMRALTHARGRAGRQGRAKLEGLPCYTLIEVRARGALRWRASAGRDSLLRGARWKASDGCIRRRAWADWCVAAARCALRLRLRLRCCAPVCYADCDVSDDAAS
jgi:adenine phosphoribosyltransferase